MFCTIKTCAFFYLFVFEMRSTASAKKDEKSRKLSSGVDDVDNKFPFVVSIQSLEMRPGLPENRFRICTGSLIAPKWVLTAAHCFDPAAKVIRYGDMTVPRNETKHLRDILKMISHPNNLQLTLRHNVGGSRGLHDIGLLLIKPINDVEVAKIYGADYMSLLGLPVTRAGFGLVYDEHGNQIPVDENEAKPLQLAEGIIVRCDGKALIRPEICVASKCAKNPAQNNKGDSGGPLLINGKIAAVYSARFHVEIFMYTPVSPYVDWIYHVLNSPQLDGPEN
jgi:hypothetical protein